MEACGKMTSPSPSQSSSRLDLIKRYEATTRRENAAREEALRAAREQKISREQDIIRRGTRKRFPEADDAPISRVDNAGTAADAVVSPKGTVPPGTVQRRSDNPDIASPPTPPASEKGPPAVGQPEAAGSSEKMIVYEEDGLPDLGGQLEYSSTASSHGTEIAEFKAQLADQKAVCEGLRHDIDRKDSEIEALQAEIDDVRLALVDAETKEVAAWRARCELVKSILNETLEEKKQLEAQLREARKSEKTLQRQLDDANEEAERRERRLRDRATDAEDEVKRLRGEFEGLRGRAGAGADASNVTFQASINSSNPWTSQQQQHQNMERFDRRYGIPEPMSSPTLQSPSFLRSMEASRASGQSIITTHVNSKGKKQLQVERKKVPATKLEKLLFG